MESVDVIIPVYNGAKFIISALKSLEAQTVQTEQVIIINDGSTDDTLAVLAGFVSSLRIVIVDKTNGGVSAARNAGLSLAKAKYVAFLDVDDEWYPEKLEKQLNVFSRNASKNIGVVFTKFDYINESGDLLTQPIHYSIDPAVKIDIYPFLLRSNVVGSPSTVLVLRKHLETVGFFDEQLAGGEDHDLWLRLAKVCAFDYVDERLVKIRVHANNAQKNVALMYKNQMYFANKWTALVDDKKLLRQWGRDLLVQLMTQLPNIKNVCVANSLLNSTAKKKMFSIKIAGVEFYVFGLFFSIMQSSILFAIKVIKYVSKQLQKITVIQSRKY